MRKAVASLTRALIGIGLALGVGLCQGQVERAAAFVYLLQQPAQEAVGRTSLQGGSMLPSGVAGTGDAPEQRVQRGREAYETGQFAAAIAYWQPAASAYQRLEDPLNQALVLSYLSLAHQQLGEWQASTETVTASLDLLQAHPNETTPYQLTLAHVLNTQGNLQFAQGEAEPALATWRQSAALYAEAGDQQRRIGSLINQAQAQQALGFFRRARQTLTEVEQWLQQQPDSALKAIGLQSLGNVLVLLGDVEPAQRVLQQSLALAEERSSRQSLSAALVGLGNLARIQQDQPAALAFYQAAADQSTTPLTRVQAQLNQLSLLLKLEQRAAAQALLPEIDSQLAALPASRAAVYARINLAQSLRQMAAWSTNPTAHASADQENPDPARLSEAAQTLAKAVQQAQILADQRAHAYALGHLGGVYEQAQQWQEAQRLTEQALLMAQAVNAPDIAYQWQWQLGRILKSQHQQEDATRSYTAAFETLQSIRSDLAAAHPDLQFSFREGVEPVYRELVDLLLQRTSTHDPTQAQLQQARQVIESLQIAELNNFFRTACLGNQVVAIDQIDQTAAAVVYPIILRDRLEIILSLPQRSLRQYTILVPQSELETTLDQLRLALEKPYPAPEGRLLGQQVYNWLIGPLAADVEQSGVNTLVFVLDGALRNVPIAALYDGHQYLIERYSVALAPSLQLLAPQPLTQIKLKALVAGLTEERHEFAALPNVEQEVAEVKAEIPSRVLLNQAFTSTTLQEQLETVPFPVVHLATHGQFSSNADQTFILAWDKPITVNELASLLQTKGELDSRAIELLVLSACETAAGDTRAALGIAGVAVRAGARSTLATLWSVDDEAGARLVSEFYRQLVAGNITKAEALRQAQLTLLRNPTYRRPKDWAPYVLLGNWL